MLDRHRRSELFARLVLTAAALVPYWRLLSLRVLYVTDDVFASDIFNGELPGRLLVGQAVRGGEAPVWTSRLCSGVPLGGGAGDPLGLALFSWLPPAPALDLYALALLLIAAHGAYWLARRLDAERPGAVLAGIAFAGSGYIAAQLKHLSITSTVVWLPVGLALIHWAFTAARATDRKPATSGRGTDWNARLAIGCFGLVFATQVLSGFPQSAYICALVYAAFGLHLAFPGLARSGARVRTMWTLAGLGVAGVFGGAAGAVVLLPLRELGQVSDRAAGMGWEWVTQFAYWPPNVATFVSPYIWGDIGSNTYIGPSVFWEDYGYVGLLPFLLAVYMAIRGDRRRPLVGFVIAMVVVAYLIVLGPATPVYRFVYELVPGMKLFRLPTRFLFIVDMGLAVLAGVGLTMLVSSLTRRSGSGSRVPATVAWAVCALTVVDLAIHQPRQNPMVDAAAWLHPPATARAILSTGTPARTYTPGHRQLHSLAFDEAHGWQNPAPYFRLRDILQPNTGGAYWGIPSADCYSGIAPSWQVSVWGDHNRFGLVDSLATLDVEHRALRIDPRLPRLLAGYGVTHMISGYPLADAELPILTRTADAVVYSLPDAARARVVTRARMAASDEEAARHLLEPTFDFTRDVVLQGAPASLSSSRLGTEDGEAHADVSFEGGREIVVTAETRTDAFLLLADTFYPGWRAEIDGRPTPIYRANLAVRAVQLPAGRHDVRFVYEARAFDAGLRITVSALAILVGWVVVAAIARRRGTRHG
jgi:hypothetical protein